MTTAPKPPVDPVRWQPPPVDPLPEFPPADLTVVGVPGNAPEDVVVDADGNIWTGVDDGRIVRIAPDGQPSVVADTGGRPLGLAVARDGRLLVCDSPRGLLVLDPEIPPADLTVVGVPGNAPEDVVVDADGNIWTGVDDGRIVRIAPDGQPSVVADTGGRPLGLAVARDGRLLVCDSPRGLLVLDP